MKLFLLILANFTVISRVYSQNIIEARVEVGAKRKITNVYVQATDTTLEKQVKEALSKYVFPRERPKKGSYLIGVAYVIAKDGTLTAIKCLSDPGYGMCAEIMRTLKKGPRWSPALQGGNEVKPLSM